MLKLNLSEQALKFLKKIPVKHAQQIDRILNLLKEERTLPDVKKLKGSSGYFRADSGEYRIIYRMDTASELLIVALIGKRNDGEVYQKFKRKL